LSIARSSEHCLNSRNGRGNKSNFVDIITSDSNSKHNNTVVVYVGNSGTKVNSVSVSFTIRHEDDNFGNVSSAVSNEFVVSVLHATSKASVSSGLLNVVDSVQEGLLGDSKSKDQSCSG
jgi:hypothetical protein